MPGIIGYRQIFKVFRFYHAAEIAFHGGGILNGIAGDGDVPYPVDQEHSAWKIDHSVVHNGDFGEALSIDGSAAVIGDEFDQRGPIVDIAGVEGVVADQQIIDSGAFHPAVGNIDGDQNRRALGFIKAVVFHQPVAGAQQQAAGAALVEIIVPHNIVAAVAAVIADHSAFQQAVHLPVKGERHPAGTNVFGRNHGFDAVIHIGGSVFEGQLRAHVIIPRGLAGNGDGLAADAFHHADIIMDIEAVVPLKADVAVFHYKITGGVRDVEGVHRGGDPIALFGSGAQPDGDAGKKHMAGAASRHEAGTVSGVDPDILVGDILRIIPGIKHAGPIGIVAQQIDLARLEMGNVACIELSGNQIPAQMGFIGHARSKAPVFHAPLAARGEGDGVVLIQCFPRRGNRIGGVVRFHELKYHRLAGNAFHPNQGGQPVPLLPIPVHGEILNQQRIALGNIEIITVGKNELRAVSLDNTVTDFTQCDAVAGIKIINAFLDGQLCPRVGRQICRGREKGSGVIRRSGAQAKLGRVYGFVHAGGLGN